MTYRERRLAKAERLQEWAEKREGKSEAGFKRAHDIADQIPFGQPILVGHHSERHARRDRDRIHSGMQAGVENADKADTFRSRAANIESAAANAIYSDDDDAIERLEERLAGLEAERARIKEVNTAIRKGRSIELTPKEQRDLENVATHQAYYQPWKKGYPPYKLTNLTGNIRRQRLRLEELRNPRPVAPRVLTLRYGGECETCNRKLARGDIGTYDREERTIRCYPPCEEVN